MHSTATTTVSSTGANMYSDAAATNLIAQGAVVPNAQQPAGQDIWLKSTGQSAAQLQATAVATVPSGNVYLYDGGATLAQKLILSKGAVLTTIVDSTADFQAPGSLMIEKRIAGPAAGSQGAVTIHTVCGGTALTPDFTIAMGSTGNRFNTYNNIPAGSVCTVTETVDGTPAPWACRSTGVASRSPSLRGAPSPRRSLTRTVTCPVRSRSTR